MKRLACLLLVPAILLTQRAGLCHGHGPAQPAGHDQRPHFHLRLAAPDDTDDDHDHDAVYLAAVEAVAARGPTGDELTRADVPPAAEAVLAWRPCDLSGGPAARPHPPPLIAAPARPLYLRHLALLL